MRDGATADIAGAAGGLPMAGAEPELFTGTIVGCANGPPPASAIVAPAGTAPDPGMAIWAGTTEAGAACPCGAIYGGAPPRLGRPEALNCCWKTSFSDIGRLGSGAATAYCAPGGAAETPAVGGIGAGAEVSAAGAGKAAGACWTIEGIGLAIDEAGAAACCCGIGAAAGGGGAATAGGGISARATGALGAATGASDDAAGGGGMRGAGGAAATEVDVRPRSCSSV